jgi:hypothetical protein
MDNDVRTHPQEQIDKPPGAELERALGLTGASAAPCGWAMPPGGGSRTPLSSRLVTCIPDRSARLDHQGLCGRIPIQGELPQRATICRLSPRIQRNPQAESLLSGCPLGPLECPSNFSRWRLLPSKCFQIANISSSPFTPPGILGHVTSNLRNKYLHNNKTATAKRNFCCVV